MPYPAKTSAPDILRAATAVLERDGQGGLSLRGLAGDLGLTPNALYRYYPTRDALLMAVAAQGADALHAALVAATRDGGGAAGRVLALKDAYLAFARARPALYDLLMTCGRIDASGRPSYAALWAFVVAQLEPLTGPQRAPEAAVALWGFLHGMIGLERAGVYDDPLEAKPPGGVEFGLQVFLAGLRALEARPS